MKTLLLAFLALLCASCVQQPSYSRPGENEWVWIWKLDIH